jgi:hypothetical protein
MIVVPPGTQMHNTVRETIPTGFVRICEDGQPIADMPIPEAERMLCLGEIYEDAEDGYQLTTKGRTYLEKRFRN